MGLAPVCFPTALTRKPHVTDASLTAQHVLVILAKVSIPQKDSIATIENVPPYT